MMDQKRERILMKFEEMRQKYIGKELKTIISLELNDTNQKILQNLTKHDYSSVESAHIMLFAGGDGLVFVDFDDDGYRSGPWYLITLKDLLDKGNTKGIKNINSVVKDISYHRDGSECVLITTDLYVIRMGQDDIEDYYPSNFFTVEECQLAALGDIIEMPEEHDQD